MRPALKTISILHRSLKPAAIPPTRHRILKMSTTEATPAPAPWYAAYPAPKSEVAIISREEVLEMLRTTPAEKRDFVLVDLRRNDFEVR
jgi:arsenical-resistance protein 2